MSAGKIQDKAEPKAEVAQLNIEVPAAVKLAIAADAKKAGRTLAGEVLHRCTVKERLKADLAAGRVPAVDPLPQPAASSTPAKVAADVADAPQEAWELLHDIREACLEQDTDTCIPGSLGRRLTALAAMYPRAQA